METDLKKQGKSLHVVTKPRIVQVTYRGVSFPVTVASFQEEFQVKVAAFMKGFGVRSKQLAPLFCELDIADSKLPEFLGTFEDKLFKDANNARIEAAKLVEDCSKATASEIKTALTKNSKLLASLDKDWKVELNFWLSQCGQSGENRLQHLVLQALPTLSDHKELGQSAQLVENIVDTKLFQFVSVGLQANLHTIIEWLKTMRDGRAPKIPNTTGNAFFIKAVEHLAIFVASKILWMVPSLAERPLQVS